MTITLKQALYDRLGPRIFIDREICQNTMWKLRDRVTRYLVRKGRLDWLTFIENGKGTKRWHAHILVEVPTSVSEQRFMQTVETKSEKLEWIYVRDLDASLRYLLKEGPDAFCVEASSAPTG